MSVGGWIARAGLVAIGMGLLATAIATAVETVAEIKDRHDLPPPGRLVSVGGYRLHIDCAGAARQGAPTVILVSGSDSPSPVWSLVMSRVGQGARVCAYDRAGTGWSDPPTSAARDPTTVARELHALLAGAGEAGPYVLVGHSSGGLYARAFTRLYPGQAAGLVLLDATPEDYFTRTPQGQAERRQLGVSYALAPTFARVGLIRLSPLCRLGPGFPARPAAQFHALCSSADGWTWERAEMRDLTAPLPPAPATAPDIPFAVVTSGLNVARVAPWGRLQDDLARSSTNSVHVVLPAADHSAFLLDPTTARWTAGVIADVQQAAANHRRLALTPAASGPAATSGSAR